MGNIKTIRVIISGRVQGVAYRAWTVATANNLSIDGWVRNLQDGTVEAIFQGEESIVKEMIKSCHSGPPSAIVDNIELFNTDEQVEAGFFSRPTV